MVAVHGVVWGINPVTLGAYNEGLKSLATGRTVTREKFLGVLNNARAETVEALCNAARGIGANAVVGMRFHDREVSSSWVELCAYGTAVTIRRR